MRLRLVVLFMLGAGCLSAAGVPGAAFAAGGAVKQISARLAPGAVAPKSAAKASGAVVVELDAKAGKACWTISIKGAASLLSAHVHRGPVGKNGPVVIPLGDRWSKTGCVFVSARTLDTVAKSPASYYVDVHTKAYVNGAVRGQLHLGA
jgi:hypothetical protein